MAFPQASRVTDAVSAPSYSDLSVVFQEPQADLILVAGDLNLYTYPVGDPLTDRSLTVWSRLAAYGLEICGPFRPDDEPRLARCPCPDRACRHVNTYLNGSNPKNRPYQARAFMRRPPPRRHPANQLLASESGVSQSGCWSRRTR